MNVNMGIAHVAVYASDLEATKDFYVKYFNGKCGKRYENQDGFSSYFVSFGNTVRLEIMHSLYLKRQHPEEYASGWSHVAFSVGDKEAVMSITEKISNAGYALYSPPRETGDGYFESCVSDPDGNRVEITI